MFFFFSEGGGGGGLGQKQGNKRTKSLGVVEVKLWVKRRHPRWMMDFFRETFMGFMEKTQLFVKSMLSLVRLILYWFLKRVVFVCFCRLSGSRISVLNRMA